MEDVLFRHGVELPQQNINVQASTGDTRVLELQRLCNAILHLNIAEDNIWGQETENAVKQLPLCGIAHHEPDLTRWVQLRLGISANGVFLNESDKAVRGWQSSHQLDVDGIVGFCTYKSLALD